MENGYLQPNYWGNRYQPGLYWPKWGQVLVVFLENLYFKTTMAQSKSYDTELVKTKNLKTDLTQSLSFDTKL